MMDATPHKEHEWLRQLVGEWRSENEAVMEEGGEPILQTGTESVRALGDLWVILEGLSRMPDGGEWRSLMALGYDPARGRFVGNFVGSSMPYLWTYDGALSEDGTRLELESVGPSFHPDGGMANYVDTIEIVSPNERLLRSRVQKADGTWEDFMQVVYRRTA